MGAELRCLGVGKSFGTLPALDAISLTVAPGAVLGLTGQSGAGKSALIRLLANLDTPSSGVVLLDGQPLPRAVAPQALGIGVIHQSPALVEHLSVTDAIFLGHEGPRRPWGWLQVPNQTRLDREAERLLATLGVSLATSHERVGNLSRELRQMVAIAQVLAQAPKVVIIDDPTGPLRLEYRQALLAQIRRWRDGGAAVLFASPNLDQLFAVTDQIAVLRQGRLVVVDETAKTTREQIVRAQVAPEDPEHLTPLLWALDHFYRARERADDLRAQHDVLEHDLAAQNALNRQLIAQLAEQVAHLDQANLALQTAQRRLLSEREQERKALARELHDQAIQDLVGLNYALDDLECSLDDPAAARAQAATLRHDIRSLIEVVRSICGELRPPTLDSLGLPAALASFAADWGERSGIPVTLTIDPSLPRLAEPVEISLFRMVQEALSNVRKHAGATAVSIALQATDRRSLALTIEDNGSGVPATLNFADLAAAGHYGLLGMSERIALVQGRLRIARGAAGGTRIAIEIPQD